VQKKIKFRGDSAGNITAADISFGAPNLDRLERGCNYLDTSGKVKYKIALEFFNRD
jgi:hypothetical protein